MRARSRALRAAASAAARSGGSRERRRCGGSSSSADVVRVEPSSANEITPPRSAALGGSEHRDPGSRAGARARRRSSACSWARTFAMPSAVEVVDRGAQADRLRDHRGAGLELPGQLVPGRVLRLDGQDHVAAGQERRHLPRAARRARGARRRRSGRAPCARSRRRSRRRSAEVDGELGHRLGAVDQHDAPASWARRRPRRLVDRAEDVRDVRQARRGATSPRSSSRVELLERQRAIVADLEVAQLRPGRLRRQLPRHDVGVVLHLA